MAAEPDEDTFVARYLEQMRDQLGFQQLVMEKVVDRLMGARRRLHELELRSAAVTVTLSEAEPHVITDVRYETRVVPLHQADPTAPDVDVDEIIEAAQQQLDRQLWQALVQGPPQPVPGDWSLVYAPPPAAEAISRCGLCGQVRDPDQQPVVLELPGGTDLSDDEWHRIDQFRPPVVEACSSACATAYAMRLDVRKPPPPGRRRPDLRAEHEKRERSWHQHRPGRLVTDSTQPRQHRWEVWTGRWDVFGAGVPSWEDE